MLWNDPVVITAVVTWNGFFLGMGKYMLNRIIKTIDIKMETINEIDRRLIHVETALQNRMPCSQYTEHTMTAKALHKRLDGISLDVGHLSGEVGHLSGSLTGLNRCVDLMNQFLIEQGGKK